MARSECWAELGLEDSCSQEHLEASHPWGPLPRERGHGPGEGTWNLREDPAGDAS